MYLCTWSGFLHRKTVFFYQSLVFNHYGCVRVCFSSAVHVSQIHLTFSLLKLSVSTHTQEDSVLGQVRCYMSLQGLWKCACVKTQILAYFRTSTALWPNKDVNVALLPKWVFETQGMTEASLNYHIIMLPWQHKLSLFNLSFTPHRIQRESPACMLTASHAKKALLNSSSVN